MRKLHGCARAAGLLRRQNYLRGVERLELRALLSGNPLMPMGGPGMPEAPPAGNQPDAFAMDQDYRQAPEGFGGYIPSRPGEFGYGGMNPGGMWGYGAQGFGGQDADAMFYGASSAGETIVYIIMVPVTGANNTARNTVDTGLAALGLPMNEGRMGAPNQQNAQPFNALSHLTSTAGIEITATAPAATHPVNAAATTTLVAAQTAHSTLAVNGAAVSSSIDSIAESFLRVDHQAASTNRAGAIDQAISSSTAWTARSTERAKAGADAVVKTETGLPATTDGLEKASLAAMPLDLRGVEQAMQAVMGQIQHLGGRVGEWLEDHRLMFAAASVTVAAAGGGAALYLRRRWEQEAEERDDETSSNWLFVRMQTTVGD